MAPGAAPASGRQAVGGGGDGRGPALRGPQQAVQRGAGRRFGVCHRGHGLIVPVAGDLGHRLHGGVGDGGGGDRALAREQRGTARGDDHARGLLQADAVRQRALGDLGERAGKGGGGAV